MKKKYPNPEYYKPSKEETKEAMQELSKYFSNKSLLTSQDHPDLKVRGKRKSSDKQNNGL